MSSSCKDLVLTHEAPSAWKKLTQDCFFLFMIFFEDGSEVRFVFEAKSVGRKEFF